MMFSQLKVKQDEILQSVLNPWLEDLNNVLNYVFKKFSQKRREGIFFMSQDISQSISCTASSCSELAGSGCPEHDSGEKTVHLITMGG